MSAKSIMIQGTGSNVGKSIIAAALCRIFSRDGYRVAPFKSQNMALNSYVTADGLEMGRAQVVQAEAAGIEPMVEMNPILLKPTGDAKSQVVVMGKPFKNMSAKEYYKERDKFLGIIKDAYEVLKNKYDIIVIEGAGSPAEINLKDRDIVNMNMAKMADAPVILVTDIDRGGSFAWLVGTLQLLNPDERDRVCGVMFNKFRGDIEILKPGYEMLENIINKPVLGTVPFMPDICIDDEDSVSLESVNGRRENENSPGNNLLDVVVIKLPRISNFTDFDIFKRESGVSLRYVKNSEELGDPDLIIIPGTKGTIGDLKFLETTGLAGSIKEHAGKGCMVFGICGGYQMLGQEIRDPLHVESAEDMVNGLGLINTITDFAPEKATHQSKANVIKGSLPFDVETGISGYEIHMGTTRLIDVTNDDGNGKINKVKNSPFLHVTERSSKGVNVNDGISVYNENFFVIGTYMHGIFDNDGFRSALIRFLAEKNGRQLNDNAGFIDSAAEKEAAYDQLEKVVRESLDMEYIYRIVNGRN